MAGDSGVGSSRINVFRVEFPKVVLSRYWGGGGSVGAVDNAGSCTGM